MSNSKIYGVEIPPKINFGDINIPQEYWRILDPKKNGFDSKGNYLSWDGFLTRSAQFKDNREAAWLLLKLKRNLEYIEPLIVGENDGIKCPKYSPSALMGKLHKIDKLSTLDHLNLGENDKKNYLTLNLVMEEAITSAQMEGAATTRPVAKEMLTTGREPRDFSEKMIINNYFLMQLALDKVEEGLPLSIELIQEFNKAATREVCENNHIAGQLREEPISVCDATNNEVIHNAPDSTNISLLLTYVCDFANTEHTIENNDFMHPIVKAIILHFMIGYIHPFCDGNGRTARALFYWYMLKNGYSNFKYISISSLLKKSNKQYARAFVESEIDEFDLTHFIDFNLNIIIRAIDAFTCYIKHKMNEIQKTRMDLIKSPFFPQFKLQHITLIQKALEDPGREFTVKECETEFNVSATAARNYLDKLSELDLLIKTQSKGRTNSYLAPRNLRERLKIED